ncbi:MAG TPA: TolC family protein [Pyrinomonadaceae bacterium]|nr:TolC family protein [Pyrinomonadaceae bacterium]
MTRTLTRLFIACLFMSAMAIATLAQTPSPTPVNPATTPATAPNMQATPSPTPFQEPNFPDVKPQPLPPMPDLRRVGIDSSNVLSLSLNDAIRRALQNNNDIEVARDDVRVAEQRLKALYGFYDPVFNMTPNIDQRISPVTSIFAGGGTRGSVKNTSLNFSPSLSKFFEKGGGSYQVQFNNGRTSTNASNSTLNPFYSSNLTLLYTQPLLRDREIDLNRHAIWVQRKVLSQTDSDFRQRTIAIISQAQAAYWNLVFAMRNQQNQTDSLNLSRQNLQNIEIQIKEGAKAPLDRAQVLTDIATREGALLQATEGVTNAENALKQIMLKDPTSPEWTAQLVPTDTPVLDMSPVDLNGALTEAHKNRPELARLNFQKEINTVDLKYYRNQAKPQIDLTGALVTTGLAGSPLSPLGACPPPAGTTACVPAQFIGGYGQDIGNMFKFKYHEINVGVAISLPLHNRTAKANVAAAEIQKEQLDASYRSQDQAIEMDVRNAAQSVDTSQKRVVAARLARESAEQQLMGEQKLYDVGRSTTFLLLQRQTELTSARTNEIQAETDYSKALADLQRATASTLRINNVVVQSPVTNP